MKPFREYTVIVEEESYCEVMLQFDVNGKLLRMYCYADNIPCSMTYSKMNGESYKEYKTKPLLNPLFVEISKTVFPSLASRMYLCMEDEEFNEDLIIQKAVMNYRNFNYE